MMNRLLARLSVAALAITALTLVSCPASAEMLVHVSSATVAPGETGFVEVYFTNPTSEDRIAAYNVGVDILGATGDPQSLVKFTSYGYTTVHTPIYGTQTPTGTTNSVLPGTLAAAQDSSATGVDTVLTENMGLVKLNFTAPLGSAGTYQLVFRDDILYTNFARQDNLLLGVTYGGDISDYSFIGGTITVTPEPSTCLLAAMGFVGLIAYAWRKRK